MSKIFVFGERLGASHLGFLSIDGGNEYKIKANGLDLTTYECDVAPGEHEILFYTSGKFQRAITSVSSAMAGSGVMSDIGYALNSSQTDAFEKIVTLEENDVLVLNVVETVTETYIQYALSNTADYLDYLPEQEEPAEPQEKKKWVAFWLCLFLGCLGAHKFYEGNKIMGFVYLCTMGFCGIGALIDLIKILGLPDVYMV